MFSKSKGIGTGGGGTGAENIVETSINYAMSSVDDYIAGTGTINITFPPKATAIKGFWIDCISGTLSLIADATIESSSTLTTGVKGYFTYLSGDDVWRQN